MGDQKTREENILNLLKQLRAIRSKLSPDILELASHSIQNQPSKEQEDAGEIKIDRKKNVKFVMDFLNSPEGAHLKAKIES